ncbi:MAG: helix-turn-helix transcriptional regulator [Bacteroidota bacterium]
MYPHRFETIGQYHEFRGIPGPPHPLISVFRIEKIKTLRDDEPEHIIQDFYSIALKTNVNGKLIYGQREYDFDKGRMFFIAPNQVYSIRGTKELTHSGWLLLIHPDLFWNTPLAAHIHKFEYFGYSVNEALHLSEKEEETIVGVLNTIEEECRANIDKFSKPVIISRIETLLNYADRFYNRQFITRERENHEILVRLEKILDNRFNNENLANSGVPSVTDLSESLNISPNYLSGLLKVLTGKSTQQHIHDRLIEKAKEKLAHHEASISEIAFQLGFDYPQSFSKLFKSRTGFTPSEFRQSFN